MTKSNSIKHIGQVLKELRKQKGITGAELGRRVGLSQSKISKIETNAGENLKLREVTTILNILNPTKNIQQQIYSTLGSLNTSATIHKPVYGNTRFYTVSKYEEKAKLIRLFMLSSIPALLQTVEYRSVGLRDYYGLSQQDIAKSIKTTLKRQDYLWDTQRKFHIIMHQAALYYVRGSQAIQAAQLDRVERLMDLPNVEVGIIPVEAGLPLAEHGSFLIWDDAVLTNATASGDTYTEDATEIDLHAKIFAELDRLAYYADEAKQLLRTAIDYFM